MKRGDDIRIVLSKRQLKGFLALAVLIGAAYALMSESFTLSTYYPAPSGVYNKMVTTSDTFLARDGGNVNVGTAASQAALNVAGNATVGGNSAVGGTLTVGQTLQMANLPDPDPPGKNGMVYYNTTRNTFRGFQNGAWSDFGGGGAGGSGGGRQVFTSDATWTVPPGVSRVKVTMVGAGGGGGGCNWPYQPGGGGGGQSFNQYPMDVSGLPNVTVKVGRGGAGGRGWNPATNSPATQGAKGGDSTFGSLVTLGGCGAEAPQVPGDCGCSIAGGSHCSYSGGGSSEGVSSAGGQPGSVSGDAGGGGGATAADASGGNAGCYSGAPTGRNGIFGCFNGGARGGGGGGSGGGASGLGAGGSGGFSGNGAVTSGGPGSGYGAGGGGGACSGNSSTPYSSDGGKGGDGIVIVEW